MILLGRIERAGRRDLGVNVRKASALLEHGLACFRRAPLRIVLVENRSPILIADVAELPVLHRGVDVMPEVIHQFLVADRLRVIGHPHRFRMAGPAAADLLIRRILQRAAGVTGFGAQHAWQLVEIGFHAPEAAAGEDRRGLGVVGKCGAGKGEN